MSSEAVVVRRDDLDAALEAAGNQRIQLSHTCDAYRRLHRALDDCNPPEQDEVEVRLPELVRALGEKTRQRREQEDQVIATEDWYSLPEGVLRVRGEALLRSIHAEEDARSKLRTALGGDGG